MPKISKKQQAKMQRARKRAAQNAKILRRLGPVTVNYRPDFTGQRWGSPRAVEQLMRETGLGDRTFQPRVWDEHRGYVDPTEAEFIRETWGPGEIHDRDEDAPSFWEQQTRAITPRRQARLPKKCNTIIAIAGDLVRREEQKPFRNVCQDAKIGYYHAAIEEGYDGNCVDASRYLKMAQKACRRNVR